MRQLIFHVHASRISKAIPIRSVGEVGYGSLKLATTFRQIPALNMMISKRGSPGWRQALRIIALLIRPTDATIAHVYHATIGRSVSTSPQGMIIHFQGGVRRRSSRRKGGTKVIAPRSAVAGCNEYVRFSKNFTYQFGVVTEVAKQSHFRACD